MKNPARNLDWYASHIGDNLVYAFFISAVVYGVGLMDRDAATVAGALGLFAMMYVVYGPFFVRSVAVRDPPQDPWRAAGFVAWGGLPLVLFIPFWSELTAWPLSVAAYPMLFVWSATALCIAGFSHWPRGGSGRRWLLRTGGGMLLIAGLPIYGGFLVAGLMGRWTPPGDEVVLAVVGFICALPFAGLAVYAGVEMLDRSSRPASSAEPPTTATGAE